MHEHESARRQRQSNRSFISKTDSRNVEEPAARFSFLEDSLRSAQLIQLKSFASTDHSIKKIFHSRSLGALLPLAILNDFTPLESQTVRNLRKPELVVNKT